MNTSKQRVLAAYKNLLRARSFAFKNDKRMLALSLTQIRSEFRKNATV